LEADAHLYGWEAEMGGFKGPFYKKRQACC